MLDITLTTFCTSSAKSIYITQTIFGNPVSEILKSPFLLHSIHTPTAKAAQPVI